MPHRWSVSVSTTTACCCGSPTAPPRRSPPPSSTCSPIAPRPTSGIPKGTFSTTVAHSGLTAVYTGTPPPDRLIGAKPGDAHVPDLIGIAQQGVVYTGGIAKIAEHGGDHPEDRDVPLVVSGAGATPAPSTQPRQHHPDRTHHPEAARPQPRGTPSRQHRTHHPFASALKDRDRLTDSGRTSAAPIPPLASNSPPFRKPTYRATSRGTLDQRRLKLGGQAGAFLPGFGASAATAWPPRERPTRLSAGSDRLCK